KTLTPSKRGELEITSLNNSYLYDKELSMEILGRGYSWLDTGTQDSLLDASNFVAAIQRKQGLFIACLEEIAYKMGFITKDDIVELAKDYKNSSYGKYLEKLANQKIIL
ncbi:MAG: glucose-1-phosphate thymidylyltransferase, partial [Bdellovibrionales bacterium]|nr:glucose-1-phosphate thymidylyltransferase [Bdellovibrionales bacterium]